MPMQLMFLSDAFKKDSLEAIQIFFLIRGQKRRHHKRRLIQSEFVQLIIPALRENGTLHLATDWEDYARHMMEVLSAIPPLQNLAGAAQYANRSTHRPLVTKFEMRASKKATLFGSSNFARQMKESRMNYLWTGYVRCTVKRFSILIFFMANSMRCR